MLTSQIKNELSNLGIKPKKSLGQNFLVNEGVYRKIIGAAEIKKGDAVVEIGPGLGTLTEYLLEAGSEVITVEKDHKLAEHLKTKFLGNNHVTIVEDDILKFSPSNYSLHTTNYKLVGNIPYYLTSHLLRTIFENWPTPESIILMVQKEVAQRITAKPPEMNMLAVLVQYYSKPKIVSYVSKNNFWPAPEVDSAIIKLENRKRKIENRKNIDVFFKIVGMGFKEKRKQLANNLSKGLGLSKKLVEEKLSSAGIEPKRRAETLTLSEWENLTKVFYSPD